MSRLTFIVTHSITARTLLRGQLAWLRGRGHEVSLIASPGPALDDVAHSQGVRTVGVPLEREIRPLIDELPELWNVLRGDMSLVGPRLLLMVYLARYTPEQARRHEVLPGLTGWAVVHGRNALTWERKFAHDVWYVDHRSLGLDLSILARTALAVLRRDRVSAPEHATMPVFMGSPRAAGEPTPDHLAAVGGAR